MKSISLKTSDHYVALHCSIAARRVRLQPTARVDGEVGRFLHRLDGEIAGRLDDDRPLTTDPGDKLTVSPLLTPVSSRNALLYLLYLSA
jgi:hypothetical protein